jgi:hypothetical protein
MFRQRPEMDSGRLCFPPSFCETALLTEPGGHHFQLGRLATELHQVPSSSLGPHADLCPQLLALGQASLSLLAPIERSLGPHGTRISGHREGCPFLACSEVSSACSICISAHPCNHLGPVVICAGAMACSALDLRADPLSPAPG